MIHPGIMFLIVVAGLYVTSSGKPPADVKTAVSTGTVIVEKSTDTATTTTGDNMRSIIYIPIKKTVLTNPLKIIKFKSGGE